MTFYHTWKQNDTCNDILQNIFEAVKIAELEAVRKLIQNGVDVNEADSDGVTPLNLAAASGFEDIVLVLLNAGADITLKDRFGFNALLTAAFFGRTDVVKILITHGAALEEREKVGFTALHLAAQEGRLRTVTMLLTAGAEVNALTYLTNSTPIALAVEGNYLEVVHELIDGGGDPTISSAHGITTLFSAATSLGTELIMDLLIDQVCQLGYAGRVCIHDCQM